MVLSQNEDGVIVIAINVGRSDCWSIVLMMSRPLAWVLPGMIVVPGSKISMLKAVEMGRLVTVPV